MVWRESSPIPILLVLLCLLASLSVAIHPTTPLNSSTPRNYSVTSDNQGVPKLEPGDKPAQDPVVIFTAPLSTANPPQTANPPSASKPVPSSSPAPAEDDDPFPIVSAPKVLQQSIPTASVPSPKPSVTPSTSVRASPSPPSVSLPSRNPDGPIHPPGSPFTDFPTLLNSNPAAMGNRLTAHPTASKPPPPIQSPVSISALPKSTSGLATTPTTNSTIVQLTTPLRPSNNTPAVPVTLSPTPSSSATYIPSANDPLSAPNAAAELDLNTISKPPVPHPSTKTDPSTNKGAASKGAESKPRKSSETVLSSPVSTPSPSMPASAKASSAGTESTITVSTTNTPIASIDNSVSSLGVSPSRSPVTASASPPPKLPTPPPSVGLSVPQDERADPTTDSSVVIDVSPAPSVFPIIADTESSIDEHTESIAARAGSAEIDDSFTCKYFGKGTVPNFDTVDLNDVSGDASVFTASANNYPRLSAQYLSHMHGDSWTYSVEVDGSFVYNVVLGFAEVYKKACDAGESAGFRVFTAAVGKQTATIDVMGIVGCGKPLQKIYPNTAVSGNKITVQLEKVSQQAFLSTMCYKKAGKGKSLLEEESSLEPMVGSDSAQSVSVVSALPSPSPSSSPSSTVPSSPSPTTTSNQYQQVSALSSPPKYKCIGFSSIEANGYEPYNPSAVFGDTKLFDGSNLDINGLPQPYKYHIFGKSWSYNLKVETNAPQDLVLGFAEVNSTVCASGRNNAPRLFSVSVGGNKKLLDVLKSAGCGSLYRVPFSKVTPVKESINISFKATSGNSMLSVLCFSGTPLLGVNNTSEDGRPANITMVTKDPLSSPSPAGKSQEIPTPDVTVSVPSQNKDGSGGTCFALGGKKVKGFVSAGSLPSGVSYFSDSSAQVSGTERSTLYSSHIFGSHFSLLVTAEDQKPKSVYFAFAEIYKSGCRKLFRNFKITIGSFSETVDVFERIGCAAALTLRVDGIVPANENKIVIEFSSIENNAMVSTICVADSEINGSVSEKLTITSDLPSLSVLDNTAQATISSAKSLEVSLSFPTKDGVIDASITSSPSAVTTVSGSEQKYTKAANSSHSGDSIGQDVLLDSNFSQTTFGEESNLVQSQIPETPGVVVSSESDGPMHGFDNFPTSGLVGQLIPKRGYVQKSSTAPSSPGAGAILVVGEDGGIKASPSPSLSPSTTSSVGSDNGDKSSSPLPSTSPSPISDVANQKAPPPEKTAPSDDSDVIMAFDVPAANENAPDSNSDSNSTVMSSPGPLPVTTDNVTVAFGSTSSSSSSANQTQSKAQKQVTAIPPRDSSESGNDQNGNTNEPSTSSASNSAGGLTVFNISVESAAQGSNESQILFPDSETPVVTLAPKNSGNVIISVGSTGLPLLSPSPTSSSPASTGTFSTNNQIIVNGASPTPNISPSQVSSVLGGTTVIIEDTTTTQSPLPSAAPLASLAPIAPPRPIVEVPANDTDIIKVSSNPLANNANNDSSALTGDQNVPSIIEGEFKDLIATIPSGNGFSIGMGIFGSLLVLLLLVLLFFAVRSDGAAYMYNRDYSGRPPRNHQSEDLSEGYTGEYAQAQSNEAESEYPREDLINTGTGHPPGSTMDSRAAEEAPEFNYETPTGGGLGDGSENYRNVAPDNFTEYSSLNLQSRSAQREEYSQSRFFSTNPQEHATEYRDIVAAEDYGFANNIERDSRDTFAGTTIERNVISKPSEGSESELPHEHVPGRPLSDPSSALQSQFDSRFSEEAGVENHNMMLGTGYETPTSQEMGEMYSIGLRSAQQSTFTTEGPDGTANMTMTTMSISSTPSAAPSPYETVVMTGTGSDNIQSTPSLLPSESESENASFRQERRQENSHQQQNEDRNVNKHSMDDRKLGSRNEADGLLYHHRAVDQHQHGAEAQSELSNDGPWPWWWSDHQKNAHIRPSEQNERHEVVDKENSLLPSNSGSHDDLSSSIPSTADAKAAVLIEHGLPMKPSEIAKLNSASDSNWRRQYSSTSEETSRDRDQNNPYLDELRRRREPYVKTVANRLSSGVNIYSAHSGESILEHARREQMNPNNGFGKESAASWISRGVQV